MSMWQDYFQHIALINLLKRKDRLEQSTAILDEFGVKYEVVEAVENDEKPCEGLVVTMQRYFRKVLSEGGKRCLIFEDDIFPLVNADTFNKTMTNCINQIHVEWDMFYLGCNPAGGMERFYSENIIPLNMAYATHAVAYSKRTMEFICNHAIHEPIDNFLVREFQPKAKLYISYPMLFTQRPNYSDIGKAYTDWSLVLERRYDEQVIRLVTDRNNANRRC